MIIPIKKIFLIVFACALCSNAQVKTGVEILRDSDFKILKGKRIGLITNPTGIASNFETTIDILAKAKNVKLVALFGPEHGVRGDVTAGGHIESYTDPVTHLPVYSLYGKTRKATPEMLKGIDVLVYDIQDIGSRSYTFINTMAYAMEAAAEQNIEFVVLDRPNPLTGNRVEGNILDTTFRSFVGQYPVPYVYGMTCGEFAQMLNGEGWLANREKCKLTVVPMKGWNRAMSWNETTLPWVLPSPHVPTDETALFYSAIGILGELQTINIGVGYTMPFRLIGETWVDGLQFAQALNAKKLPGIYFRPLSWKPYYGSQQNKNLQGVEMYLTDPTKVNLTNVQIHVIETLIKLYPDKNPFVLADSSRNAMFDKVMGTDTVRKALTEGKSAESIIKTWEEPVKHFMRTRKKYLLYD